jgi:hypothetical protein
MIRQLLRGMGEGLVRLVGVVVVLILMSALLILPLTWLERYHRGVFWAIVILTVWLSISFVWRLASRSGEQICPQCGKNFFSAEMH